jgi:hypothetical protein
LKSISKEQRPADDDNANDRDNNQQPEEECNHTGFSILDFCTKLKLQIFRFFQTLPK